MAGMKETKQALAERNTAPQSAKVQQVATQLQINHSHGKDFRMSDLTDEIAIARREVRLAQGQALAEEEQEAKRREKAMDELNDFLCRSIGVRRLVLLRVNNIWYNDGPAATWTVEGIQFHLRKVGEEYVLSTGERTLVVLAPKDPNFGDYLFVAIGDELDRRSKHA
jgi:hypothetical protein